MATLFHVKFDTTRFLNFVQTDGAVDINSGALRILKDTGAGGTDGWDETGVIQNNNDQGYADGHTWYWQAKAPTVVTDLIVGINRSLQINKSTMVGVLFNAATGKIDVWDKTTSVAGSDSFSAGTWYDFKLVANGTTNCTLYYRATAGNANGDLPGGAGSWTLVGDSTNPIHSGVAYTRLVANLYTAQGATDYSYVDEFYHTDDGSFTTQTARASSEDSDTCDDFDEWIRNLVDGTYSINSGALRVAGSTGNYGQMGWYRRVPQTTEDGAYFFYKFKSSSGAGGSITMVGIGDSREANNWHFRNALYIDTNKIYFYSVGASTELENFQTDTWYYVKVKINANGTATYYYNTTGWNAAFTTAGTTNNGQSFNHLTEACRAFVYQDRSAPTTLDFDDYAYNPDGSEHPLYPNQGPSCDAGEDQTVEYADGATLEGSATDDGAPNPPGALTYLWEQVSGPGTATFDDDTDPETHVTFDAAGDYVLSLTADDGDLNDTDEVTITVNPADTGIGMPVALRVAKHRGRF